MAQFKGNSERKFTNNSDHIKDINLISSRVDDFA